MSRLHARAQDGASFALDTEVEVPALWGHDGDVAWASQEPLMIPAPQGVGKTTLTQRLMLHRLGLRTDDLLGMPVATTEGRIMYIAADRPTQAARSMSRMVSEADREALEKKLVVWRGPLPFDLGQAKDHGALAEFVDQYPEISDVFVDSLKDVAVKLTDDEVGSRVNAAFQELTATGREAVIDHHQRKGSAQNRKPSKLEDVFGSTWLTAGMGSVLLLWGEAGDPIVELSHLKQPCGEVGPHKLLHDHDTGAVTLYEPVSLLEVVRKSISSEGMTARLAAEQMYDTEKPSDNEIEKVRKRLKRLTAKGSLVHIPGSPDRWRAAK